jgi:uncharacterized membrane protein
MSRRLLLSILAIPFALFLSAFIGGMPLFAEESSVGTTTSAERSGVTGFAGQDGILRTMISGTPGSEIRAPFEFDPPAGTSNELFRFSVDGLDPRADWTVVTPDGAGRETRLAGTEPVPCTLIVSLPTDAEAGTQCLDLVVQPGEVVQHYTVQVVPAQSIAMTGPAIVPPVMPGDELSLPITILNDGGTVVNDFVLAVDVPRGWTVNLRPSERTGSLQPGDYESLSLDVTVSGSQASGLSTITLSGDSSTVHSELRMVVDVRQKPRILYALAGLVAALALALFAITRKYGRR